MQRRWNTFVTGDPDGDPRRWLADRLPGERKDLVALSLGCGTGRREVAWAELGVFQRIEGIDLSEPRIASAREEARRRGLERTLHFRVADLYEVATADGPYDVVIAEQSLHHFAPMRRILGTIEGLLKRDGLFLLDEYVGPSHFQWTDAQLAATNRILAEIPERLRVQRHDGRLKRDAFRPSRLRMFLRDPSEAVASADILPGLHEVFDVLDIRSYGGNVLHILFEDIAHNFLDDDEETRAVVERCFAAEDAFLASGVPSDFVVAAATRRP